MIFVRVQNGLLLAFVKNPLPFKTLGQLGQVMDVAASGDCIVKVNGFFWVYNPKALVPAPGETPDVIPGMISSYHLLC